MFDLFMEVLTLGPESKVLDLGVSPDQSLPESNFFEALYRWKNRIVAASIEDARWLEAAYPGMKFVHIRPGPLPFFDNEFDAPFCSAVVEHVGDREAQRAFVSECLRVSKQFFVTTPNRQFPIELHTFLPQYTGYPGAYTKPAFVHLACISGPRPITSTLFRPPPSWNYFSGASASSFTNTVSSDSARI